MTHSIAIVGMACEYPDARSPEQLWENVIAQRQAFRPMPPERLRIDEYPARDARLGLGSYGGQAALLEGYTFDRHRFRIAGPVYRAVDLSHWLALDCAERALRDAGFPDGDGLPATTTGVLLGNTLTGDYSRAASLQLRWPYVLASVTQGLAACGLTRDAHPDLLPAIRSAFLSPLPDLNAETLAGWLSNTIAGRICNYFDLKGGGFVVDGACASSLLAVASACSALRAGDLDVAIAGGVDLSIDPFELVGFARAGALAAEDMRPYDRRAAGFWPGEGCGLVVLMRAADARSQGRATYAELPGWGVSSDGHGGITRPQLDGQVHAIRRAYRRAGLTADSVALFEGHGTGTAAGDEVEIGALTTVLTEANAPAASAAIGSVKANIGHTKAAAGVAGLIKAVMAIRAGVLPPATGCAEPRATLNESSALRILQAPERWPPDRPRRAGVSAMGFGGINVHVVVEDSSAPRAGVPALEGQLDRMAAQEAEILPLAAADVGDLTGQLSRICEWLRFASRAELTDLAVHFQRSPRRGQLRAALVARTPAALIDRCQSLLRELAGGTFVVDPSRGVYASDRRDPVIGLLYSGQGSPKPAGGGRWALRFSEVRELYAGRAAVTGQESVVLASLAGLRVLGRSGLRGQFAVGHSLGELTALHWADAIDESTLLDIVGQRARVMERYGCSGGAMAALAADARTVRDVIADEDVVVACVNGPTQAVISGDRDAVDRVCARARVRGIAGQPVAVPQAFHSSHMSRAVAPFARVLDEASFNSLRQPVYSTVLGRMLRAVDPLRDVLRTQLTAPVRFAECVEAAPRADVWIEVGPGDVLARLVREQFGQLAISLNACGDSLEPWLHAIGAAYALGAPVAWEGVAGERFSRPIDFVRQRCFLSNPCSAMSRTELPNAACDVDEETPSIESAARAAGPSQDPLTLARQLIAERVELPVDSISPDHRLLSDLHLNSMTVGLIAADLAGAFGVGAAPFSPSLSDSTIAGLVDSLLGRGKAGDGEDRFAGVAPWVRPFRVEYRPAPRVPVRRLTPEPGEVELSGDANHPYRGAAIAALRRAGGGTLVCLPANPEADALMPLFAAGRSAAQAREPSTFVVLHRNGGGRGFCRTLALEAPQHRVILADVSHGHPDPERALFEEISSTSGFREIRVLADDQRRTPVLVPVDESLGGPPDLSARDVVLVTGGAGGITAECGLALARAAGCRLAVVGRSAPSATHLRAFLERCEIARASVRYEAADVRDERALAGAVDRLRSELGPITFVIHGAGVNDPCLLPALDENRIRATVETKVIGARNLLSAVDRPSLRGFVAFGSAIAQTGLAGEAHYAAANELLAMFVDRTSRELPACRCLTIDWSVWSGAGMAERLDRVESLERQGVTPITIDRGVELFLRLVTRAPYTEVIASGRLGRSAPWAPAQVPAQRFIERPRVHVPNVEIVADADLSLGADPYLADHRLNGRALMPAVMSLEAMAQAARMLVSDPGDEPVGWHDVRFDRPIPVSDDRPSPIRIASLVTEDGIAVTVRSAETGFLVDHAAGTFRIPAASAPPVPFRVRDRAGHSIIDAKGFYGSILFQGPRFQCVRGYRVLHARHAVAELESPAAERWFGAYSPQPLALGDPGLRDSVIHFIQACIPDRRIVPTGIDSLWIRPSQAGGSRVVHGVERSQSGAAFLYDVVVTDAGGICEVWRGLHLHAIGPLAPPNGWPVALLGPLLERSLTDRPDVRVLAADCADHPGSGRALIRRLVGGPVARRADGRPEAADYHVSAAHAGGVGLAVASSAPVACDIEPVRARPRGTWTHLLREVAPVLDDVAADREPLDAAATRLWCVRECLHKLGLPVPSTIVTREQDGTTIVIGAGDTDVITRRVTVRAGAEFIVALTQRHEGAGAYLRTHAAPAVQASR